MLGTVRPPIRPQATSATVGASASVNTISSPVADASSQRGRHAARGSCPRRSIRRLCHGHADRRADRERAVDQAGDRVGAARLGEVEDRRQRVEPVGQPREHRGEQQRRDVRRAQYRGVAGATGHPADATTRRRQISASARARSSTASSIAGVRRPVNVFCWLG